MLTRLPRITVLLTALMAFTVVFAAAPVVVHAQQQAPIHKKNWVQRHPTATAIGAAALTHHALKVSAANKKRNHQKLNFAERHPTLSAIGVGVATHHIIKKHTPQ